MLQRFSVAVCISLLSASPAAADCGDAVSAYNSATSEIESRLRRYVGCIEGSQGQDDCYAEFRRLKSAQDEFETAVNEYQSECE